MGCGISTPKPDPSNGVDTLEFLDPAIDAQYKLFKRYGKREPGSQRFWATFTNLVGLLKKRASVVQHAESLDSCIGILQDTVTDNSTTPVAVYQWCLLTLGEAKLERFWLLHEKQDIDDAIMYLVRYAVQTEKKDLDIAVPLSQALKASYENSVKPEEMGDYTWILETVWPKVLGTKVGIHAMRCLGFLWRKGYMDTGNIGQLVCCIAATRASYIVTAAELPECEDDIHDLLGLEMKKYFFPMKIVDRTNRVMPQWVTDGLKSTDDTTTDTDTDICLGVIPGQSPIYRPLEKRQIRLVELQPGESSSPVHGRLMIVSLDSNPTYEVNLFLYSILLHWLIHSLRQYLIHGANRVIGRQFW
jgi:hypothetical protein